MLRPYRKGMRWRRHDSPDSRRASCVSGSSRAIAFAVFRLIIGSYLVGCWTGSSVRLRRVEVSESGRVRNERVVLRAFQLFGASAKGS